MAKLDVGAFAAGCSRHGDGCHADCPDCARVTATKDDLRLEIMGFGCFLSMREHLLAAFFNAVVDERDAFTDELHVTLDVEIPTASAFVFQTSNAGRFRLRTARLEPNGPTVAPGRYIGEMGSKLYVAIYDKKAKVAKEAPRDRTVAVPRYAVRWKHITRIELRLRPRQLGLDGTPSQILEHAVREILTTFVLIDARQFADGSAMSCALQLVHVYAVPQSATHC